MKLSKGDKIQIQMLYASGSTITDIAKKFNVSITAIAKQLKKPESEERLKKFNEVEQKVNKSLRAKAHDCINQIMDELPIDIVDASIRDKINALDRLVAIYGLPEDEEEKQEIKISFEDASINNENNQS